MRRLASDEILRREPTHRKATLERHAWLVGTKDVNVSMPRRDRSAKRCGRKAGDRANPEMENSWKVLHQRG
jgi:hypothetical protein